MYRSLLIALTAVSLQLLLASAPCDAQGRRWGDGYFPNLPVVN